MDIYKEILNLKDGEVWIWPKGDRGKAEIWRKNNSYFLFEIFSFGRPTCFIKSYPIRNIKYLIETVKEWNKNG